MRVRIIDNPYSFRGPYPVRRVLPILAQAGWSVDVAHREPRKSVRAQVLDGLSAGCELIVGAGGDGTLRDIASALAGHGTPLGVLPGGTANVWAHELGIPRQPEEAARMLLDGTTRQMDLGRVVIPDGRYARFLLMAGIGIDGLMLALTDPRLKRVLGAGGIALGALQAIPVFRPFSVRIVADGVAAWEGRALQVIVGNTRRYANVVEVTPLAHADDGSLDVTVVPVEGWRPAIRLAWSLVAHRRPRPGDAPHIRGRELIVETDYPPPIEVDGSALSPASIAQAGRGPYRIVVEPLALRVRVPATYRGGVFLHAGRLDGMGELPAVAGLSAPTAAPARAGAERPAPGRRH